MHHNFSFSDRCLKGTVAQKTTQFKQGEIFMYSFVIIFLFYFPL